MAKIVIAGAGITGLSSAYELIKKGHEIHIIDKNLPGNGCSYGNAGMIVPSHFITLPAPGVIAKALGWMTYSGSPFSLHLSLQRSYLDFLWKFFQHSNHSHEAKHRELLARLHLASRDIFLEWDKDLPGFDLSTEGITMLYNSKKGEREEKELGEISWKLGMPVEILDKQALQVREPGLNFNALGGVHYTLDAHLNPGKLMNLLRQFLEDHGAVFHYDTNITAIECTGRIIKGFISNKGILRGDSYVVATGSWSENFMKSLGIYLPVQSGKGYSFTTKNPDQNFQIPKLINEAKVKITPLGNMVRFGGTMEIGNYSTVVRKQKIRGIVRSLSHYFPGFPLPDIDEIKPWYGFRPVSPDGLPYLGRSKTYTNLVLATGHSMIGLSLAPITGRLVAQLLQEENPGINIDSLDPERFN